jgi:hypothetical protein
MTIRRLDNGQHLLPFCSTSPPRTRRAAMRSTSSWPGVAVLCRAERTSTSARAYLNLHELLPDHPCPQLEAMRDDFERLPALPHC